MDKKPNVFPSTNQKNLTEAERLANFEREKSIATREIYENAKTSDELNSTHKNAVEMMMQRTREQLQRKNEQGIVIEHHLAENEVTSKKIVDPNEELMRKRDEQLKMNKEQTENYQKMYSETYNKVNNQSNQNSQNNQEQFNNNNNMSTSVPVPPSVPPVNNGLYDSYGQNPNSIDPYIYELSQPNYNAPFDVLPLPSRGKVYKNKKPNIKLAYMTTADENILTSPNLLQSGQFLEILINRKMLDPSIRYENLTIGDRNAIMLWLRATAYGEMYPVTILDENGEPFETEINLNELKEKELIIEPDENGEFDFLLPLSKNQIKFKFLTCGDVDWIERKLEEEREKKVIVNNASTYKLEKQITEVNGSRDRNYIKDFSSSLRIADAKALTDYIESIESGIELNIDVKTPGGGSVATFLPLSVSFFWPNIRV